MTTREAGAHLGIGDSGVRMLVQRGALTPVRRRARPLRFHEADVWRLERERLRPGHLDAIRDAHAEADKLASQVSGV